jgi:hypothetical protein
MVLLQTLVAAGLLGVSLWWYRRDLGERSTNAGCALWLAWIVFGIVSVSVVVLIKPRGGDDLNAMLLGIVVAWVFCGAGIVLGLRLLMRASPDFARELIGLTMLLALGLAMLTLMALLVQALGHA